MSQVLVDRIQTIQLDNLLCFILQKLSVLVAVVDAVVYSNLVIRAAHLGVVRVRPSKNSCI